MRIRITNKTLSLPPYLSTAWANISALHTEEAADGKGRILVVTLLDQSHISVPNLSDELIAAIFRMHTRVLEEEDPLASAQTVQQQKKSANVFSQLNNFLGGPEQVIGFPLKFGPGGLEALGSSLQHNPAQAKSPEMPADVLQKISSIAKIIAGEEAAAFPLPEENCNCMHCQIMRAIHGGEEESQPTLNLDEEVKDEELSFRLWDIAQKGDHVYAVSNPLDPAEEYNVYLGEPIGCTCGTKDCEHIKAVLRS